MKGNKTKARSSPMEKTSESRHQRLFEENVRKIKKRSTNLKRRVQELFNRVCNKKNVTTKLIIFPKNGEFLFF